MTTPTQPCRIWLGAKRRGGYGERTVDGRVVAVHRLTWEEAHGPIPAGMEICHTCDNPPCYEITHLFAGTKGDNMRDAAAKGRLMAGERHCGARLTAEQVAEIRATVVPNPPGIHGDGGIRAAGRRYGVNAHTIWAILRGKSWVSSACNAAAYRDRNGIY